MLASTWFDPVLGVDIHIVLVPSPVGPIPTPLPHPFIGMVFDPMGMVVGAAISTAMGAGPTMTMVNSMPATNCGTAVMAMPPHLPMPPGVAHPKPPGNDAELFFGGMQGGVQGSFGVRLGDIALSCADPVRMPTSTVLAIPKGAPVMNMKPMAPDLAAIAMAGVMKGVMKGLGLGGRALRALQRSDTAFGRAMQRTANALKNKLDGVTPNRLRGMRDRAVCFLTGHPVDVATGRMFTEFTDLELPGPLPLKFERAYDTSFSWRDGTMGRGWSHSFESSAWVEPGKVVVKWEDGRELEFSTLDMKDRVMREGQSMFDPIYRMTLKCTGPLRFEVQEISGVTHKYEPVPGGDPNIAQRVKKRDRSGFHLIEYHYDRQGRVEWIRDCGGRLVGLEYDKQGRLGALKVPLAKGHGHRIHRRFFYSKEGDLTRAEDSLGHSWHFDYAEHLMVQETDRTGLSFYFQYDRYGAGAKCVRTWGDGGIYDHVIAYMPDGKKTIVEDSLGAVTVYEMDELGQMVAVTDAMGATTKYGNGENGRREFEEDALGRTSAFTYNDRGNLVSATAPDGTSVGWNYDNRFDIATSFTNALGSEWTLDYDAKGRLAHRRSPDAQSWSYRWNEGLLVALLDNSGREIRLEYDDEGTLASMSDADGAKEQYGYDKLGRLVKHRDSAGSVSRFRYDTENRTTKIERPLGLEETRKHDKEGNLTNVCEGTRNIVFGYQGFHRLAWREEADARTCFDYDTEGRMVAVRNEAGERYALIRDLNGRLTEEIGFDGTIHRYSYDRAGQRTKIEGPELRATGYTYDDAGRLVQVAYPDGTFAKLGYRADGALIRAENADATVEFDRDALGRVLRETLDGGTTWVSSTYSVSGRRERLVSSLGADQCIEHDPRGQVVGLLQRSGASMQSVRFERDAVGRESVRQLPGGVQMRWQRDEIGRPLERALERATAAILTGTSSPHPLVKHEYRWKGYLELEAILANGGDERWFTRDKRGRVVGERQNRAAGLLIDAESTQAAVQRAMDAVGNVYRRSDQSDRKYGRGGQLQEADGTAYAYGTEGERTEKRKPDGSTWRYRYNGSGKLQEVATPDNRFVRFAYDALGRRIETQVWSLNDEGDEGLGSRIRYVWDGNKVIHEVREAELSTHPASDELTTWYWEPNSWAPIAKVEADSYASIHTDHLGTPSEMTDDEGQLIWRAQLDVFGVPEVKEGKAQDCPWRWAGQYQDEDTGLYYNNYRYYDPESGQYISQDPIGLRGGTHLYSYVDDMTTWGDPWGLSDGFIFRGVHANHPALADAKQGVATPAASSSRVSATEHNKGGVSSQSPYTSWTHDPEVAHRFATSEGPGGVVLVAPVGAPGPDDAWRWEFSDDVWLEKEVLLEGQRTGLEVLTPEEFEKRFKGGGDC